MRILGILGLCLAVSSVAYAGNSPQWDKLVQKSVQEGAVLTPDNRVYLHYLQRFSPADKTPPYTADYFSTVGSMDQGQFVPSRVSVVSEHWSLDVKSDWHIEQWIYSLELDGTLDQADHFLVVETKDGTVLDSENLPVGSPDQTKVQWNELLQQWYSATGLVH